MKQENALLRQRLQEAEMSQAEFRLRIGSNVRIHGLRTAVELNNTYGTCAQWDAFEGRWLVRLPSGDVKAILPENLEVQQDDAFPPLGPLGLAKQVAELECGPLRQCTLENRPILKKKILVKWHPDKQPSLQHMTLATQVTQELQNQPEWRLDT